MKKGIIILSIIGLLFSCNNKEKNSNVNEINIHVENVVEELDISSLFEDSIDIIPLETSSSCLLSHIQKVEYKNQFIYISDDAGQQIYVFDKGGKYIRHIGARGTGPDEYSELGDFMFVDDSIFIQDKFQKKILIYNDEGNYLSPIKLKNVPYVEFTNVGINVYFIVNYEKSEFGYDNLISLDLKSNEYKTHLPYNKDTPRPWGLSKYTDNYKGTALFTIARDNHIYQITNDTVMPKYVVHFTKNNIPSDYLEHKDGGEILAESMDNGYITGINSITYSKDYLFLSYTEGDSPREVLFDVNTGKIDICNRLIIKDFGDLYVNKFITTDTNEFIIIQDASMFINAWKNIYKNGHFKNKRIAEKMESLYNNITEDDNPVLFKLKFK